MSIPEVPLVASGAESPTLVAVEPILPTRPILNYRNRAECERLSRENSRSVYLGDHTLLCNVLDRFKMYVDARDIMITPHLVMDGFWEMWVTQALAQVVEPGMHVVNVGANFGFFSLLLAELAGPKGSLVAVEPQPNIFRLLSQTIEINGYAERTQLCPLAVGSRDGETVTISVPQNRLGGATVAKNNPWSTAADTNKFEVKTTTLDSLLNGRTVDFMLIDAEGYEPEIWQGMQQTLLNPKIAVMLEFTPGCIADPEGFLKQMVKSGFLLRAVNEDGGIRHTNISELMQTKFNCNLYLRRF